MDKLRMQTANKADENFRKLAAMFPNAVTETINENGEVVRAIDKDVLMQEISCTVVDGNEERYQFTWPDKKKSVLLANAPINKTLRPVRDNETVPTGADSEGKPYCSSGSVDFDTTENLYIEGDNLEVLKLLQETYLGKIKLIYIDPPYNTGNDFVYEDDFAQSTDEYLANSGQFDEEGNRLVPNTESNGRFHTDWLNMMYPRLRLSKDLLAEDGAIFISIDDHECDNLKKMCDEIFGADCFKANLSWQRTYSIRNDSKGVPTEVEHILVYSRDASWEPGKLPRTEKMDAAYSNPDGDFSPWMSGSPVASDAATHQGMVYAIQHPFTGEMLYPSDKAHWRYSQEQMLGYMNGWCRYKLEDLHDDAERARVCGVSASEIRKNVKAIVLADSLENSKEDAQAVYDKGPWPRFYFTNGGKGGIRRKVYLDAVGGRIATNYWCYDEVGHTDEAKKEVKALFEGTAPFDTPKPVRLIDRILTIATDKHSIVLDFFSGSATTAHAVMRKNAEDKGSRKYILVQLPEKSVSPIYNNLCEIGKARIRRAGEEIQKERAEAIALSKHEWDQTCFYVEHKEECDRLGHLPDEYFAKEHPPIDTGFRVLKCDTSNMKEVYYNPAEYEASLFSRLEDNIKEDRTPEDLLFQVMLDLGVLLSSKIEETTIAGKKVFNVEDNYLIACFDSDVTEETITAIAKQKPYYFVMRNSSMANDSVATNFDQIFATYSPDTVRKVL